MKRHERGSIFSADLEDFISFFGLFDLDVHRFDHGMVFLSLIGAAHKADADDVIARVGFVECHFFQRQIAKEFAANSVRANGVNAQERPAIVLGKFVAELPPIFTAYVLCVHILKVLR